MDGEPAAVAQAKRIAERDNINSVAIGVGADDFTCRDGDGGCREAYREALKVHRGGGRLRRWAEAGEALVASFDHAACADSDEIRREETRSFLRGLCVEPLVFDAKDGLRRGRSCSPGLWPRLRGCAEESNREHQSGDDRLPPQILMKIFLR
jgi:hypothetical protein